MVKVNDSNNHARRNMIWTPLSVSTGLLISPTAKANETSSKGFCIWPFPKYPRSPFLLALLHSEYLAAYSPNTARLPLISSLNFLIFCLASSRDLVIFLFRKESTGFLDPVCFWRMCEHLTYIIQIS